MLRPLKVYYCPPRPGDVWPPVNDGRSGGSKPTSKIQEKPEGCRKLFMGNLSYEIDDDTIVEFFKPAGVLTGLRWLTRKDTGEFRVCALYHLCMLSPNHNALLMACCRGVVTVSLAQQRKLTRLSN